MSPAEESTQTGSTEEKAAGCCEEQLRDWYESTEKYAREEPVKAVGWTFLIGLIIAMLPLGKILGGIVRLFGSLVRPALLVLGAMKVFEEIDKRRS